MIRYILKVIIKKNIYCIKNFFRKKYSNIFAYKKVPLLSLERRSGNTTRLIDYFIQDFFIKGECRVYDHFDGKESGKRVFNLVMSRLKIEHNIKEKDVKLDVGHLIIKNLKYKI